MEFNEALSHLNDCETCPVLTVKDGIVTSINIIGSELNIPTGTAIKSLINSGLTDYEKFSTGVLFLTLTVNDTIQHAAVIRRGKEDIFILDSKHSNPLMIQANNLRKEIQKPLGDAMIILDILASNPNVAGSVYLDEMRKSIHQILKQTTDMRAAIEYTNDKSHLLPNQNLNDFLDAYLTISKPQIEGTGFKFKYTLPQKHVICSADFEGIKFAVANMISTAIKYGKRNRTLHLKMISHPNYCTISISNLMKDGSQSERFYKDNVFPKNLYAETGNESLCNGFRTLRAIACQHKGSVHYESLDKKSLKITLSIPTGIKLFNGNIKKLHTAMPAPVIRSGGYDPMLIVLSDILPSEFYK